jgi:hypothetical protein
MWYALQTAISQFPGPGSPCLVILHFSRIQITPPSPRVQAGLSKQDGPTVANSACEVFMAYAPITCPARTSCRCRW